MFISQTKEILDVLPTAKFDDKSTAKLIRSIEEEEEQMLEPLLGEDLMLMLYMQYKALITEYGSITSNALKPVDGTADGMVDITYQDEYGDELEFSVVDQQKTIPLLRNIQSALVYRMLSNKIFSLATSLNMGGGANRASAGDYEPADDKHLQEVRKEYYMNSRKACDNILVILERDAKTNQTQTPQPLRFETSQKVVGASYNSQDNGTGELAPSSEAPSLEGGRGESLWFSLWQNSDGYYLKEDLLFPTLRSLKPYYPCNEPTKYLSLAPVIRYCQDTYILPRVDDTLIDSLLGVSNSLTDTEKKAQKLLRTALAYYIRAKEGPRDERNEALMTADSAMSTALAYIEKNFTEDEEAPTEQSSTSGNQLPLKGDGGSSCPCCKEQGRGEQEYETFSTLFAPGLNRW